MLALFLLCALAATASHAGEQRDVSSAPYDVTDAPRDVTDPPPRPYVFAYTAGRFPGHADRQHTEVSDGSGVVRGSFSYVDPRQKVRTVDYVADKSGFHPVLSEQPPEHPADSAAVALEKRRHYALYSHIAEQHATNPHPGGEAPRETAAVRAASQRHSELFRRIAEQHARIAAERELLQLQEPRDERERQ